MEKTKRLFDEDVYLKSCTARIIEKNNLVYVFDQTIFFPEGGGQLSDKGTIEGIEVLDVKEKEGIIYHTLASELSSETITMCLDYEKRFDEMQQHCGEHILSGVLKSEFSGNNKGFHIGKEYVTIDIDVKLSEEDLFELERLSNEAIYKNLPVKTEFVDDVDGHSIRKESTVDEDIRIVTIPDVDCVACCGTHPHRTGEVGIIKLYKLEKNKGLYRLYFKCGRRALEDLNRKVKIVQYFSKRFSADDHSVIDQFEKNEEKNEHLRKDYMVINRKRIEDETRALLDEKPYQIAKYKNLGSKDMNFALKLISDKKDVVVVLYSESEKKIMMSHDGNKTVQCNELFKSIRDYNGKGGGSAKSAQGIFDDNESGYAFLSYVQESLEKIYG